MIATTPLLVAAQMDAVNRRDMCITTMPGPRISAAAASNEVRKLKTDGPGFPSTGMDMTMIVPLPIATAKTKSPSFGHGHGGHGAGNLLPADTVPNIGILCRVAATDPTMRRVFHLI